MKPRIIYTVIQWEEGGVVGKKVVVIMLKILSPDVNIHKKTFSGQGFSTRTICVELKK